MTRFFVCTPSTRWNNFSMSVFLSVLGAGVLLASWLLVQQGARNHVIYVFSDATRNGNLHLLDANTDWNAVRSTMKQDLKLRAPREGSLPQDPAAIDALVDYYVRPQNLPSLLYYYNAKAARIAPEDFVRKVRLSGMTEFTVEIASPPQYDRPWLNDLEPVRAVFALDGLAWKLKKIDAPAYLIPATAPTTYFAAKKQS